MAIQETDLMDFGNGIIGDDTFDVWRKKTNRIKIDIDLVNTNLTTKINTDIGALTNVYIPQSGTATAVSTQLSFSTLQSFNTVAIGGTSILTQNNVLKVDKELDSAVQVTSDKVQAKSKLILASSEYDVPTSSPGFSNAVLTSNSAGQLAWQPASTIAASTIQNQTQIFEEILPVGSVVPFASFTDDDNYLLCEGGSASKASFPELYEFLKNGGAECIYGETETEFTLPDYQGRVLVGKGIADGVQFGNSIGISGGTGDSSTLGHVLSVNQMPAHRHWSPWVADDDTITDAQRTDYKNSPLFGADSSDISVTDRIHFDADSLDAFTDNSDYYAFTTYSGGDTGDASLTGLTDVTNDQYTGNATTLAHSHTIKTIDRIQPHVTVRWFIKAKPSSKINFGISVASSGLISTTAGGNAQSTITPVDETITLKINPDTNNLQIKSNGTLSFAESPIVEGKLKVRGVDIQLYNETRAGSNTHSGRCAVHGNGNGAGDPTLNDYNRKTVTTIRDSGVGANNDTLIINYNDVSPNSVGDYTGGVIINGTKAIMFQDGSILQTGSVPKKGNFKKATEPESGKHTTVAPQYADSFMYIDDDDDVVVGGNGNGVYRTGGGSNDAHSYRTKFMLPDDEKADKLYVQYYSMHVITKTGKSFSTGYGYTAASALINTAAAHSSSTFHTWIRSFCESDNCKISKIVASGDLSGCASYALDEQGYLWGHGVNQYGNLANGTTTYSPNELLTNVNSTSIIGKRESLANSETLAAGVPYNLSANRRYLPHIINPMLDSSGNITTNVSDAVSLLKVTDATHFGSYNTNSHPDTIAILGTDKRVYVAGYGDYGQTGDGSSLATNSSWRTVSTGAGVPLENITKIYSSGEDQYTFMSAIDESYDVWFWGSNGGYVSGLGLNDNTDRARPKRTWDASARGYRANFVITNNAGTADGQSVHIIGSHQTADGTETDKRYWYAGANTTTGMRGQWYQLQHGPFNTTTHSIQDMYYSSGNDSNFYYVLARNKSTSKLELWSAGNNGHGQLGYQDSSSDSNFANVALSGLSAHRINFSSDLLEKVVTIHCARQHNSGQNTHVHLSDGRIFMAGYSRWGFREVPGGTAEGYSYKFTPIKMD